MKVGCLSDDTDITEALCHNKCGTIKVPSQLKSHRCQTLVKILSTFVNDGDVSIRVKYARE